MLTYFPPGVQPDLDALANGADFNDDGHGFAIVTPGRLVVRHGMDSHRLIERFGEFRAQNPDGPALFHSRFATHGTRGRANCHPFRVGHDPRTVLAHNGILPRRVRPKGNDRRSDTRIAAEDFLPIRSYHAWDDPQAQRDLARWLGTGNKFVVLTVDPRYRQHAYLINEQAGMWEHDIWYSNSDYLGYTGPGIDLATNGTVPGSYCDCPVCLTTGVVDGYGYCLLCGACADCAEPGEYCVCYAPGRFADSGRSDVSRSDLDWPSFTDEVEQAPAAVEVSR
jgi:glutamine amidotransferase